MLKTLFLMLFSLFLFAACSGPKFTADQVKDKVMTFHMYSQSRAYDAALRMMTKDERKALSDQSGEMKEEYKSAMRRMQSSQLLREKFALDKYGNLIGGKAYLDKIIGSTAEDISNLTQDLDGLEASSSSTTP